MSTSPRRSILLFLLSATDASATLNANADKLKAMVGASIKQATAHGFDIAAIELNPGKDSLDASMEKLGEKLQSQHWDGFLIGFAVRGNKEQTPVFEAAVNLAARKAVPTGTKLLFGNAPDDLMVTLERNFVVVKE
ncbi:hypothetical protein LTR85_004551 [Meristemomyces frigidus]|nr:hypothetical protein LTR85_004551 [Meristemomyces frigidus]